MLDTYACQTQLHHRDSLREYQSWRQATSAAQNSPCRATIHRILNAVAQKWQKSAWSQLLAQSCRQQFELSARRWQALGFTVCVPPDFSRDNFGCQSRGAARLSPPELAFARQSRFGFALRGSELSASQRRARWRLYLVWFLAVMLVSWSYLHLPAATAQEAALTASPVASSPVAASPVASTQGASAPVASSWGGISTQTNFTQTNPDNVIGPNNPEAPTNPNSPGITLDIRGFDRAPSTSVLVFLLITVLSVAPSLMLMMTSFTKIFIVLAMTRNAMGLNQIPPNQVIAGLSLFLSIFIMVPTLTQVYDDAVVPYMDGKVEFKEALKLGEPAVRNFMGPLTREEDIALMTRAAGRPNPPSLAETPFTTLVPAFMISEVRSAFIIGFVIFIPFLVIDLIVGASLMSMGMMMLPPVMISLPFKVLLFVMVDGWGMLTKTLIGTYR